MKRAIPVLLAALIATVSLSACGSDDSGQTSDDTSTHNDTDVAFAQDMIPHHAQAVEMSDILLAKSGVDPNVADLATQIKQAQAPEIDTMTGWLEGWGEDVPATSGMSSMDDMEGSMDGMMSTADMRQLESATGDAAARLFLEQMTEHHSGAIAMAEQEVDAGAYPEAVALAETIIKTQQAEIDTMQGLLAQM